MIWLLCAVLAAAALAPLAWALRAPPTLRGRADADLGLYRAQLAELDRERDAGRLDAAAHAAATLEVQRRLLAAPPDPPAAARPGRAALAATLVAVPVVAFALYATQGWPGLPAATLAARQLKENDDDALLAALRARLAQLDPASEAATRGQVLLGNAERSRGRTEAAIAAYRAALAGGFDADTVALLAQTLLETNDAAAAATLLATALPLAPDHVGLRFLAGLAAERDGREAAARETWAALLRDAPADAPWRAMVERRMETLR